jgi:hypothetical protein
VFILFNESENLQRHFIDVFSPVSVMIKPILLQYKEHVLLNDNVDMLRLRNLLNPLMDGDRLPLPAYAPISASNTYPAHVAIMNASKAHDYVLFGAMACPSLLFNAECFDLFKSVAKGYMFTGIFRDLSLSFHYELDSLTQTYPTKHDNVVVPRSFKIKKELKDIAKSAVKGCVMGMVHRRSYITAELTALKGLIMANPGLIAPKFPQVIAACAFAKTELFRYFRHQWQDKMVRKDCRKHYHAEHYVNNDVHTLIAELYAVIGLVKLYKNFVRRYYAEFLREIDLVALAPLCEAAAVELDALRPFLDTFPVTLRTLDIDEIKLDLDEDPVSKIAGELSGESGDSSQYLYEQNSPKLSEADVFANMDLASPPTGNAEFTEFRLNWSRCLALINSQRYHSVTKTDTFDKLARRMSAIVQRTTYVDSIDALLKEYCDPFECWWFRTQLLNSYKSAVTYNGIASHAFESLAYTHFVRSAILNLHMECPAELPKIFDAAVRSCDIMVENMSSHVMTQLRYLWDNVFALSEQYQPIEAARRAERSIQMKKTKGSMGAPPPLPGCESEAWAKSSISRLVSIRNNLTQIIAAAEATGKFTVCNREYNIVAMLRHKVLKYLEDKFRGLFFLKGFEDYGRGSLRNSVTGSSYSATTVLSAVERPSASVRRLLSGCQTIQIALSCAFSNFPFSLRSLLFKECVDTSVPPPGRNLIPETYVTPANKGALIWTMAEWFEKVVELLANAHAGYVWVPSKNIFLSPNTAPHHIETLLNDEDLRQLCAFIGPQGVRTIDARLLRYVSNELRPVIGFLSSNRSALQEMADQPHQNSGRAFTLERLSDFEQRLVNIGVALVLRDMIHKALGESMRSVCPSLHPALEAFTESVCAWGNRKLSTPLYTMCADAGAVPEVDLALAAAIEPVTTAEAADDYLHLFPAAAAATFASEHWDNANYVASLEAFDRNEHCMMVAVSKLIVCFFGDDSLEDKEKSGVNGGSKESPDRLSKTVKRRSILDPRRGGNAEIPRGVSAKVSDEVRKRCGAKAEAFLSISAELLLAQRKRESSRGSGAADKPLRAMSMLLELFVDVCPLVSRHHLETCMPYSLMHATLVDLYLGRQRQGEDLQAFTKNYEAPEELNMRESRGSRGSLGNAVDVI